MTDLIWHRTTGGTHVAAVPSEEHYVDRSWHVWKQADRRWAVETVIITRQASTYSLSLPPVSVEVIPHGTAYTLREAKEIVSNFQRSNELAGVGR